MGFRVYGVGRNGVLLQVFRQFLLGGSPSWSGLQPGRHIQGWRSAESGAHGWRSTGEQAEAGEVVAATGDQAGASGMTGKQELETRAKTRVFGSEQGLQSSTGTSLKTGRALWAPQEKGGAPWVMGGTDGTSEDRSEILVDLGVPVVRQSPIISGHGQRTRGDGWSSDTSELGQRTLGTSGSKAEETLPGLGSFTPYTEIFFLLD